MVVIVLGTVEVGFFYCLREDIVVEAKFFDV